MNFAVDLDDCPAGSHQRPGPEPEYYPAMQTPSQPIQPDVPRSGLTPSELAHDLLARIDQGNAYARTRKKRFRSFSSTVRLISLGMSAASTIILGLQNLNVWTSVGFSLVAMVTVVSALEPFFAWRSRWVLMEEAQYKFYRLRDELTFYSAATKDSELNPAEIRRMFDEYQNVWEELSGRWLEYRRPQSTA